VAVLLTGAAVLSAALFPSLMPPRLEHADTHLTVAPDFPATVTRLNATFHTQWEQEKLVPAGPADDLAVARRLSLALTGSIPSLQEVRQFESLPEKDRLARWVASILADRRYADYFAERFARVYVGTEDGPFIFYRRRRFVSWLSDQFSQNRPYDGLVRELIASRGLWTDVPATNFITVTFQNDKGPDPERLAARVSRAFLGIRLDCAQCHDHPFEPWTQRDFQGLAAFFGQAHKGFTGVYDGDGEFKIENKKTKEKSPVVPRLPASAELLPVEGTQRQRLAQWVTHPKNPYFARATVNRVWALMFGRPLADPVDNLPVQRVPRLPGDEPYAPPGPPAEDTGERKAHPALDVLAEDFVKHGYDLHRLIHLIAASEAFRLDSAATTHELTDAHEKAWACFPMSRLRPEQVAGSVLQSASVKTIDYDSHIFVQLARSNQVKDFVHSYGDTGEDEFDAHSGTIPQRLILMNGRMVHEKTRGDIMNAAMRISQQAPTDASAIETAYLSVLTRRPTPEELAHFTGHLSGTRGPKRSQHMEDLFWTLLNSTEFSWNH
jgi:hypothetical protein